MTNDQVSIGGSTREPQVVSNVAVVAGCLAAGAALAVGYVIVIGILAVEVMETKAGIEITFQNDDVLALFEPHTPWLPVVAIAALSALMCLLVTVATRGRAPLARAAIASGFVVALAGLVVWAFTIKRDRFAGDGM